MCIHDMLLQNCKDRLGLIRKTSAIPKFKKAFSGWQLKQTGGNHKSHVKYKKFEIQHLQITQKC